MLTQVFKDIADSIRSKTGKTDKIKPVNMAEEISKIDSGSKPILDIVSEKGNQLDINLRWDYYSWRDFLDNNGSMFDRLELIEDFTTSNYWIRYNFDDQYGYLATSTSFVTPDEQASPDLQYRVVSCSLSFLGSGFEYYEGYPENSFQMVGLDNFEGYAWNSSENKFIFRKDYGYYCSQDDTIDFLEKDLYEARKLVFTLRDLSIGEEEEISCWPDATLESVLSYRGYSTDMDDIGRLIINGKTATVNGEYIYDAPWSSLPQYGETYEIKEELGYESLELTDEITYDKDGYAYLSFIATIRGINGLVDLNDYSLTIKYNDTVMNKTPTAVDSYISNSGNVYPANDKTIYYKYTLRFKDPTVYYDVNFETYFTMNGVDSNSINKVYFESQK